MAYNLVYGLDWILLRSEHRLNPWVSGMSFDGAVERERSYPVLGCPGT